MSLSLHGPFHGTASSLLHFIKDNERGSTLLLLCCSNLGFGSIFSLVDYLKQKQVTLTPLPLSPTCPLQLLTSFFSVFSFALNQLPFRRGDAALRIDGMGELEVRVFYYLEDIGEFEDANLVKLSRFSGLLANQLEVPGADPEFPNLYFQAKCKDNIHVTIFAEGMNLSPPLFTLP